MASLLETFSPRKKRPAPTRPPLLPWEQELLDHPRVPVVVPPQTPAVEREDPSLDDLETKVPRTAIFPSRSIDIDGVYEAEVTAATALRALRDVRLLVHDDRLIAAAMLLEKLEACLETLGKQDPVRVELEGRMRRPRLKAELQQLRERAVECREAAEDLSSDEGWTLACQSLGFATYIRPLQGQWYVKVVGEQEGTSVFDQLAVVREAGLYHRWGPFVGQSAMVHKFRHLDLIVHFDINAPLLHRDGLVRGYGCDYAEKDMILICGDVARPEDYPDCDLPPDPNGWFHGRLQIKKFRCQVQIWGVNKGKVTVAAIIDPRVSLPQSVVSFAINRIIGVLLYLIIRTARRVDEEGARPGTLGADVIELIRRDPYYAAHCLPRILWYCERKGWAWPGHPSLPATPPKSEAEALALAGILVSGLGSSEEETVIARGESEASSASTISTVSSTRSSREGEAGERRQLLAGEPTPAAVPVAAPLESVAQSSWSSASGTQKRKHFLRRLFRRRKHKHHHHKPAPAMGGEEPVKPQHPPQRASSAGGGGGGGGKQQSLSQQQQSQSSDRRAPSAARGLPSPQAQQQLAGRAVAAAAAAPAPASARAATRTPVNRGEAALWGLLWTVPLLVLGYTLVRAAVVPVVHAYAGAGGEAVVLAVLLQQVTALLARHGWLPPAAGGTWEVKLRFQLPHLVLVASLALAGACLAGAALHTHEWAPRGGVAGDAEAWDRIAGARVRAANSGLFLLLLAMVVVGQRKEIGKLVRGGERK